MQKKEKKKFSLKDLLNEVSFEKILNSLIASGKTEKEINDSLEELF